MALDLFLRAEDRATLRTVVRSAPFRTVIGDVRDPAGAGFVQIPGSVDWVFFPSNRVVITPGVYDSDGNEITPPVTDSWVWLHLRLTGSAEVNDLDGVNDQPDRWDRSKIRAWMQANGTFRTIRGVRVYEHTLGTGKRIQVWRGSEMEALGVKFHEYFGGSSY